MSDSAKPILETLRERAEEARLQADFSRKATARAAEADQGPWALATSVAELHRSNLLAACGILEALEGLPHELAVAVFPRLADDDVNPFDPISPTVREMERGRSKP